MENFMLYVLLVNLVNLAFGSKNQFKSDKLQWVNLIPLAIGAVSALAQNNQAKKQKKAAEKAMSYSNPYVDAAADTAKSQSNQTRYVGQDQDESNVRQSVADTFGNVSRSTRSSGDILNASSRLSGQQQREYQNIGRGAQIFRQGAMDRYRQSAMQQASVRDQNRQYSENLKGAAAQNQYNAWNSLLGGVAATNFGSGKGSSKYTWGQNVPGDTGTGYNWGF
jgi:hypothetical protein